MNVLYEIVNPSDAYTMRSDNPAAAAAACLLLGGGSYGLTAIDPPDAEGVPVMLFWDEARLNAWWADRFGGDIGAFISERRADIAEALESVVIGSATDRKACERALTMIEGEDAQREWREKWHDDKRSSMNDIGAAAIANARALRATTEPTP